MLDDVLMVKSSRLTVVRGTDEVGLFTNGLDLSVYAQNGYETRHTS